MPTIENIKKVSFIFFATLGVMHILAGLMTVNNFSPEFSTAVNRILDIPFLAAALIYGISGILLRLPKNRNVTIAFALFGVLLLLVSLYINLAFPDLNRFILN